MEDVLIETTKEGIFIEVENTAIFLFGAFFKALDEETDG